MTTPFSSQTYPSDPTVPEGPPAGYVAPPVLPSPSTIQPPLTSEEIDSKRKSFYELILQQVVTGLTGFFLPGTSSFGQLSTWASNIPLIGPLVGAITGIIGGGLDLVANLFTNVLGLFGVDVDFNESSETFSPPAAALGLLGTSINPSSGYGGLLSGGLIPGLDGSKIVSGELSPNITGLGLVASSLGLAGTPGGAPVDPNPSIETAALYAANLAETVKGQQAALASVQAWIAGQSARTLSNAAVGGLNRNIILGDTPVEGDPLSSTDFASTGPTSGDLCVRGTRPMIGIKANKGQGTYYGILNYTYKTENQALEVVLTTEGLYPGGATTLYTHSNATHTEGAYCRIFNNGVEIGAYTRVDNVYTYSKFSGGGWNGQIPMGQRVKFYNDGTIWKVVFAALATRGGGPDPTVLSIANSDITFDASHRRGAISMDRFNVAEPFGPFPAGYYDSYRVASIAMFDAVDPVYAGSGGKMARTATAAVDAPAGAFLPQPFPDNYFDASGHSEDVTADTTTGTFTVQFSGYYKVSLRVRIGANSEQYQQFGIAVLRNGQLYEKGMAIPPSSAGIPIGQVLQSEWTVPLVSGDDVQAAYETSSVTYVDGLGGGTSAGTDIYFTIALMSKDL